MENVEVHVTADNTKEAHELMRAAMARGLEEVGLVAEQACVDRICDKGACRPVGVVHSDMQLIGLRQGS